LTGGLEVLAIRGLPEIRPGDDLAALIVAAAHDCGIGLRDGDVVAVSSKAVAKAEDRYAPGEDADQRASAIASQTVRVVAQRLTPRGAARIVESASGPVLAAAGVDASNVPAGADGAARVLLLPADPDASARGLRTRLTGHTGVRRLAVVVTDTLGRPWRVGQTDAAVGAAGLVVAEDLSGHPDTQGRPMEVTLRALADEVAAAADLVKGKTDGAPVAVLRGLAALVIDGDGAGAAALLRPAGEDWFRHGHAEAARAAIGVGPETEGAPLRPVAGDDDVRRLERAVAVTAASGVADGLALTVDAAGRPAIAITSPDRASWVAAGALAQRLVVAAWAEELPLRLDDIRIS
jgi:coenzyme F420-0:L-glutamate ligase/coenzyme F420-1:gamma-L-glutamate ligase